MEISAKFAVAAILGAQLWTPALSASDAAYQPLREQVLITVGGPNGALLLVLLGLLGIYAEFCLPGLVIPGVIGTVLSAVGITALMRYSIDWRGAALLLGGLILSALEARFATRGVLTAGGGLAMYHGSLLLIDTNLPELRIRWSTALLVSFPFALLTSFLLSVAWRARRNKICGLGTRL